MQEIWQSIIVATQQMSVAEMLAVVFAVASVFLSKKENILVYPTGITSVLIYVYLCFEAKIYADVIINVFYFVMSIYGWYNWVAKRNNSTIKITKNSNKENLIAVLITLFLWFILYFILTNYTDSPVGLVDSFTTAVFFVGMWLMAWKRIENWLFFIVGDIVSIPLYWSRELHLSSLLNILLTVIAILAFFEWRKKLKSRVD